MIPLPWTPLTKYALIGATILVIAAGAYHKIASDARREVEQKATADALRRTQDAIRAGDAVDLSSDRLRKPDGHNRD